ncbi:MAG: hypothetical protein JW795_05815, partial [Chitinivibrionales bacterium]|nr:hypothetical protein [Chitinivibrionales bacterium]
MKSASTLSIVSHDNTSIALKKVYGNRLLYGVLFVVLAATIALNFHYPADLQGKQLPGTLFIFILCIICFLKTTLVKQISCDGIRRTVCARFMLGPLPVQRFAPWFPALSRSFVLNEDSSIVVRRIILLKKEPLRHDFLMSLLKHNTAIVHLCLYTGHR